MPAKITATSTNLFSKRVLVAPLDWGLGHATRCVPIIYSLREAGFEVWLAGDGAVRSLLQGQFPYLPFLPLQGYNIRYGRSGPGTFFLLLWQLPRFLRSVKKERRWLQQAVKTYGFSAVISDSRYGLYHPDVYAVFITHQLQLKAPLPWLNTFLRRLHFYFIQKFDHCWVPDAPGAGALAGVLSHPGRMPKTPTTYIGHLSRLKKENNTGEEGLLLLLSGPEPQRTILEQKLLAQAGTLKIPITLVRGLPGAKAPLQVPGHIAVHNYLDAAGLQKAMQKAALVICRSGYSTLMDLARMQKKSVLVPTPAQPEQQYLARHLARQGHALWQSQHELNLQAALHAAAQFSFRPFAPPAGLLPSAVAQLKNRLEMLPAKTSSGPLVDK